uniref:Endonuclease n=1 Tax=Pithovirus LCPAC406 TaxID=2506599 RepID=A0A481ZFE4_9VIRU|nr:MAG: endonuclease [Pithovirus LCPAC406]
MKCFTELFPDDERSKKVNTPTKEYKVKDYLNNKFPDVFIHNKSLMLSIKANNKYDRRIDFQTEIDSYVLCVEVDENQHRRYEPHEEKERTKQIQEDAGRNVIFIRFNPDNYTENGKMKNTLLEERYPVLKAKIDEIIENIRYGNGYSDPITEFKLFYNDVDIPIKERSGPQCEGITRKNTRCKNRPIKNTKFCYSHTKFILDVVQDNEEGSKPKCVGITKKKTRCRNKPIKGTKSCRYH